MRYEDYQKIVTDRKQLKKERQGEEGTHKLSLWDATIFFTEINSERKLLMLVASRIIVGWIWEEAIDSFFYIINPSEEVDDISVAINIITATVVVVVAISLHIFFDVGSIHHHSPDHTSKDGGEVPKDSVKDTTVDNPIVEIEVNQILKDEQNTSNQPISDNSEANIDQPISVDTMSESKDGEVSQ